jgi:hypothetical protein
MRPTENKRRPKRSRQNNPEAQAQKSHSHLDPPQGEAASTKASQKKTFNELREVAGTEASPQQLGVQDFKKALFVTVSYPGGLSPSHDNNRYHDC